MTPNQQTTSRTSMRITDGMTVYGADREKLGTVRNYDPEAGYLDIQKGWLFTKDFYVGLSAIDSVDEHGINLHLTKEVLNDDRFATPPMRGGFAYSGDDTAPEKEPVDREQDIITAPPSGTVY
jgi:hypothetical protein